MRNCKHFNFIRDETRRTSKHGRSIPGVIVVITRRVNGGVRLIWICVHDDIRTKRRVIRRRIMHCVRPVRGSELNGKEIVRIREGENKRLIVSFVAVGRRPGERSVTTENVFVGGLDDDESGTFVVAFGVKVGCGESVFGCLVDACECFVWEPLGENFLVVW
jgi:hypothetical protein